MDSADFSATLPLERVVAVECGQGVAAAFALMSKRSLWRAEQEGKLTPIRRGKQNVSYERGELLRFLGISA